MKAALNNYRQSPRKVRLAANLIKGQSVPVALEQLRFLPKRAAAPLVKLLKSAVANSRAVAADLTVGDIRVDQGATLKRRRPRARGSASPINKRTSRVYLTLNSKQPTASSRPPEGRSQTPRL